MNRRNFLKSMVLAIICALLGRGKTEGVVESVKVTMLKLTPKMDNFGINASNVRARIDELLPANTDEWRSGGSFASVKPGIKFPPYVRRDEQVET